MSTKLSIVLFIWRPINFVYVNTLRFSELVFGKKRKFLRKISYRFYKLKLSTTAVLNRIFKNWPKISIKKSAEILVLEKMFGVSNFKLTKNIDCDLSEFEYPIETES